MLGGLVLFMMYGLPQLFEFGRRMNNPVGGGGSSVSAQMQPESGARAGQEQLPKPNDENIAFARASDTEMAAARDKARASLDTFWTMLAAPQPGITNLSLKVSLPTRSGSLEHIWIGDIARQGDTVRGRLANTPRDIAGLKMGSEVSFSEDQIDDWTFSRNGKIVGNETARPLLARMPAAQAAPMLARFETP